QRVVRHGYGPERSIQTGIGALDVRRPKVRDRAAGPDDEKVRFTSNILPKWARRSRSLDALLVLYLRGISTGGLPAALAALLGADSPYPTRRRSTVPCSARELKHAEFTRQISFPVSTRYPCTRR